MMVGGPILPQARSRPPASRSSPSESREGFVIAPTPSIRETLQRYGIAPHKRFGQNFLHDPAVCARIVAAVGVEPGEAVLEVGPGLGALTAPLLAAGARVTAVEVDRRVAACLRDTLGDEPGLHLREADILDLDPAELAPEPVAFVGNLPYAITGPVLGILLDHADRFPRAVLMVQKEGEQ